LKSGSLNLLEPLEPVQACNGIALPFLPTVVILFLAKYLRWVVCWTPQVCYGAMTCNGKGEVILVHTMMAYWGVKVHSLLTMALDGG